MFLGRSKGASSYFVVSFYKAAPQNETPHHEAENVLEEIFEMEIFYVDSMYIGRQIGADKKLIANEPERLRQFLDHCWKALGEENPDLPGIFCVIHFHLFST